MRNILFILMLFCLWGCGTLIDKTEEIKQVATLDHKLQTKDKGNNSYSGDPLEPISVTASGNANVDIIVGEKARVEKNEKRDTATEEEIESSFSLDAMVSQVSPAGWALLAICSSFFLFVVWWIIKTTAVGRTMDQFLADSIDTVNEKLNNTVPGSDLHTDLLGELAKLRGKQRSRR